ncbi:DedA family protein [Desulfobacula sp.]
MIFPQNEVVQWIFLYKYYILFPVMVVEGPVVTLIAGMYVSTGHLDGFVSYIVLAVGDLVGDSLYYALGYRGRETHFSTKWNRLLGVTRGRVNKFEAFFQNHKIKTLLIGKWSHAVGVPVLVAAGLSKVPYWQFLAISTLATLPKTLVLLGLGYYFGKNYSKIATGIDYSVIGVLMVFLIIAIYFGIKQIYKKY